MSSTRVSIIFPYNVPENDDKSFQRLLEIIQSIPGDVHTSKKRPILVVNNDTIKKGAYDRFGRYLRRQGQEKRLENLEVLKVWSVDTCQMWLAGFGEIINANKNEPEPNMCVLQIPGDLKHIKDFKEFIGHLRDMRLHIEAEDDFTLGDFEVTQFGSKHVIDIYGTYPLLYNWFPAVSKTIFKDTRISKPRSEFIGAKIGFLEAFLPERKFAYEQTVVFLIHALTDDKKWNISRVDLGSIEDYDGGRGFREANDQLERMDRMLKLLWREKNGGDHFNVIEFERREKHSSAIREAAIVSFRNFLGVDTEFKSLSHQANKKVAGFETRWSSFRGFSLLFDNPGSSFTPMDKEMSKLEACVTDDSLQLYQCLATTLDRIERDSPLHGYSFCRLPKESYHVTVWDGVNDSNLNKVLPDYQQALRTFLDALPSSINTQSNESFIQQVNNHSLVTTDFEPITFKFYRLVKWRNEVLVAQLIPESGFEDKLTAIRRKRSELFSKFRNCLTVEQDTDYLPHITLGYFIDSTKAMALDEEQIIAWTEEFNKQTTNITITFERISLYGFTDMVTFFKRGVP